MTVRGSGPRCLAVLATLTAAAASMLALTLPVALAPADPASFEELLVRTCAAVASIGVAWLWLGTAALGLSALCRIKETTIPGVPAWARRLVLAGCGAALVAASGTPALAAVAGPDLPVPDRTEGTMPGTDDDHAQHASREAAGVLPRHTAATVTVSPGDSLWAIAESDLGEDASAAAIDAHWRVLYARNAAVVGTDPDLILPGQQLHLPEPGP